MGYTEISVDLNRLRGSLQILMAMWPATMTHSHAISELVDRLDSSPAFPVQTSLIRETCLILTLLAKISKSRDFKVYCPGSSAGTIEALRCWDSLSTTPTLLAVRP